MRCSSARPSTCGSRWSSSRRTCTVPADPDRLHQVVANLLHNAVRHSPDDDEVRLEASVVGGEVRIDVVDHGPGIARDQRAHVFERFVRGNSPALTGQGSTGGTGLGLAIVRWAVDLHGGRIEVADSDVGCIMRVTLPAQAAADPPGSPASHDRAEAMTSQGRRQPRLEVPRTASLPRVDPAVSAR